MTLRERLLALYRQAHGNKFGQSITVPEKLRLGMRYFAPQAEAQSEARDATVTMEEPGEGEEFKCRAVINTNEVDRYGTIVEPRGCKADNFKKNPVLLWAHGHDERVGTIPIGNVPALRITESEIEADVCFDTDEPGATFGRKYASKKLRGFSIGFLPVTMAFEMIDGKEVMRFLEWELVELSAVGVPANPSCLARDIEAGEYAFESKIVTEGFEAVCECVARGDDPENLLCRVLDVQVPDEAAAAPAVRTVASAPADELNVPASIGVTAAATMNSDDPLGLGHMAAAQRELGGVPAAIPTGIPAAGSGSPGLDGFTAARFAAAAPAQAVVAGPQSLGSAAGTATPARTPEPGARIAPAAVAPAACGCGGSPAPAARDLTGELDTLLAANVSPELRAALTALRPSLVVVQQADAPDWRGIWSTDTECRTANPDALPLMSAASVELQGQRVFVFVHHRAADGALSVTALQACMRELIGEANDLSREALGEAYDHLSAHMREVGIVPPDARPHTPGECYDLALRGIVTHYTGGQHYVFDRAEERELAGTKHFLPIFRSIETGAELAFQPPNVGRLTDHNLWGRRDLPAPTGQEAILERLAATQERLLEIEEQRVGAKFSRQSRERMAAAATNMSEACGQIRGLADSLETIARDLSGLLGDSSDEGDRGVGGSVLNASGSGQGASEAPVFDEEFIRTLRTQVDTTLNAAGHVTLAQRRAAQAPGVQALR